MGSLTCISGTKISPGFSSFETFKPKVAQNRKQRCDSPVHRPSEHKTTLDTQKFPPVSRLPKPKVYTTKLIAPQTKPPLIRRSAQFNLSSITSITKEDEVARPKKVPPPVPPRKSSLTSTTISKTSLEEYADKLGSTESQTKIGLKCCSTKSQVKIDKPKCSSSTEPQAKTERPKNTSRAPVSCSNISTGAEHSSKDTNKIHRSRTENCSYKSLTRSHTVEKSARPRIFSSAPLKKSVSSSNKTPMVKHASYESTEKNGHVLMTSTNAELENVYKKITKYNWNSTEFGSHTTTTTNPTPLSSTPSSNNNTDSVRTHDCVSPHSSIISTTSMCSTTDCEISQTHNTIGNPQPA